jgi:hypothetical protein
MLARQALYHFSHTSNPKSFSFQSPLSDYSYPLSFCGKRKVPVSPPVGCGTLGKSLTFSGLLVWSLVKWDPSWGIVEVKG